MNASFFSQEFKPPLLVSALPENLSENLPFLWSHVKLGICQVWRQLFSSLHLKRNLRTQRSEKTPLHLQILQTGVRLWKLVPEVKVAWKNSYTFNCVPDDLLFLLVGSLAKEPPLHVSLLSDCSFVVAVWCSWLWGRSTYCSRQVPPRTQCRYFCNAAVRYQRTWFCPFDRWRIKMPRTYELCAYSFLWIVINVVSEAGNAMRDFEVWTLAPQIAKDRKITKP